MPFSASASSEILSRRLRDRRGGRSPERRVRGLRVPRRARAGSPPRLHDRPWLRRGLPAAARGRGAGARRERRDAPLPLREGPRRRAAEAAPRPVLPPRGGARARRARPSPGRRVGSRQVDHGVGAPAPRLPVRERRAGAHRPGDRPRARVPARAVPQGRSPGALSPADRRPAHPAQPARADGPPSGPARPVPAAPGRDRVPPVPARPRGSGDPSDGGGGGRRPPLRPGPEPCHPEDGLDAALQVVGGARRFGLEAAALDATCALLVRTLCG